jgi:hypothetical protein
MIASTITAFREVQQRGNCLNLIPARAPFELTHTTEFLLVNRPISHPIDISRLLAKGGLPLKMARSVVEWLATTNIKGRYYRIYIEIAPGSSAEAREVRTASMLSWTPMAM